jgi:hypothetical protein
MRASVGRIVLYTLTEHDAERVNRAITLHDGNQAHLGDVLPMLIVRVWSPDLVNGQVFLDGNYSLWVTSAAQGTEPRQWHEPPRV